jgi:hypothetical protein
VAAAHGLARQLVRNRAERRQLVTDEMEAFDRGLPFADPAVADLERTIIARAFASLPERWQAVLWHTESPTRQVTGTAATAPLDLGFHGLARIPVHQAFADVTGLVAQHGSGTWSATAPVPRGWPGWPRGTQAGQPAHPAPNRPPRGELLRRRHPYLVGMITAATPLAPPTSPAPTTPPVPTPGTRVPAAAPRPTC